MAETVQGPRSTANTRVLNPQPGNETRPEDGARPTESELRKAMADNPGQRADNIEAIIAKGDSHRPDPPKRKPAAKRSKPAAKKPAAKSK